MFTVAPDVFGGIQFGSVGGQIFGVDAALLGGEEVLHESAAMCGQTIPHQEQFSGNMLQQMLEKGYDLWGTNRFGKKTEVKVPQRNARDHRERFPVEVILQHRCLASPGPRSAAVRPLTQSTFVQENDGSPFFLRFFLMSGQVTFFQWRMVFSLRSRARPVGRWQLQPRDTSNFHTWPG